MTDAEVEARHKETMKELGRLLDISLNPDGVPKFCFCLLITEFGDVPANKMSYISNATREDMLVVLKEFISRSEIVLKQDETVN